MLKKVRTGIIGGGMMGNAHAAAVRRLGFVDVVAVAERDQETADKAGKMISIEKTYGDYRKMLEDDEIDVVHVLTPNKFHFQMSKDALEAGKNVICEKPLSMTFQQGRELLEAARKSGKCYELNHNMRYYPMVKQTREYIQSGDAGEIRLVNGAYLQDWLFLEQDYNWRVVAEEGGVSRAVADIGTHIMDMVQYVTGLKIVSVYADLTTFIPVRKKPKVEVATYMTADLGPDDYEEVNIDTEDHGSLMVKFSNGAKGVFMFAQVCAGRKNHIRFEIFGSKRSYAWCGEEPNQLWIGSREQSNSLFVKDPSIMAPGAAQYADMPCGLGEGYADTFMQSFKDFYTWVREEKKMDEEKVPFPTFKTGCQELAIVDAVLKSNEKNKWVDVPEVK
jgi:predicted dehydrogenase